MPLYFAYGANMDAAAMARRCPASRIVGLARLARHRLVLTTDGYLSVTRDPAGTVQGVLWNLAIADVRPLDRFEGVDRGLYVKLHQPVITPDGPRRALIYVGAGAAGGTARPGYLEDVVAAARGVGLPVAYLTAIARLGGASKPTSHRPRAVAARATQAWRWEP